MWLVVVPGQPRSAMVRAVASTSASTICRERAWVGIFFIEALQYERLLASWALPSGRFGVVAEAVAVLLRDGEVGGRRIEFEPLARRLQRLRQQRQIVLVHQRLGLL